MLGKTVTIGWIGAVIAAGILMVSDQGGAQNAKAIPSASQETLRRAGVPQNTVVVSSVSLTPRNPWTADAALVAGRPEDVNLADGATGVYTIPSNGGAVPGQGGAPYAGILFAAQHRRGGRIRRRHCRAWRASQHYADCRRCADRLRAGDDEDVFVALTTGAVTDRLADHPARHGGACRRSLHTA